MSARDNLTDSERERQRQEGAYPCLLRWRTRAGTENRLWFRTAADRAECAAVFTAAGCVCEWDDEAGMPPAIRGGAR